MTQTKFDLKKKRIRALFLTIETKLKKKQEIDQIQEKVIQEGMAYRQMRLSVEKITENFENSLKEKIEKNFLRSSIRKATEKDLHALKDLYNHAWLASNTPFRPIEVDSFRKIYSDPKTVIFIAKVYGMDVGFTILDFEGPINEYGIIAGLGVLPRFLRRGMGTVLGMAAWNFFKEKGVKELRCEVYKDNEISYSFIKSMGFEEYDVKVYRKEDFEIEEDGASSSPFFTKP